MKTSATNRRLRVLLAALRNGSLMPRPEFQRKLVWANKNKTAFIQTVLEDFPFPEIYVAAHSTDSETGESTELLVDGQQRITTLFQYFSGSPELKLGGITPYSELDPETKLKFLEYEVVVRDLGSASIADIKEVFRRINSTDYALNAMEMHNARYNGELKQFVDEISCVPFFQEHRVFSANDLKRMNDLRFVLTVVATILSTYFHRDEALESFLERYNDQFEEEASVREGFGKVLTFIDDLRFSQESRAWKKGDLFTLIVELYRALVERGEYLDAQLIGPILSEFYREVDAVNDDNAIVSMVAVTYQKYSVQGSNDRSSRINRGLIIEELISGRSGPESPQSWIDDLFDGPGLTNA